MNEYDLFFLGSFFYSAEKHLSLTILFSLSSFFFSLLLFQLVPSQKQQQDDERLLQDVQRFYNTQIEELPSNVADLL